MIDWSPIRVADIISIASFMFAGFAGVLVVKYDMRILALKFGFLEETVKTETEKQNSKIDKQSQEISKFGELLALMGKFEERFLMYEERHQMIRKHIDELRHGIGWIVSPQWMTPPPPKKD